MGNLVEELVRIVHGGGSWVECAGVDELAEDREVILEMSFDGKGICWSCVREVHLGMREIGD